jgi:hypothetical protein
MGSFRNPRWRAATVVAAAMLLTWVSGAGISQASEAPLSRAAMTRPLTSALERATPKRIPSAARVLDLKQVGRKGNARSVTITSLREVHRFARLVDRLPVQTVFAPCPLRFEEAPGEIPSVRLIFRATTGGAPLAEAIQDVPVSICAPLELAIRGHEQEPRIHGQIIVRAVTRVFER